MHSEKGSNAFVILETLHRNKRYIIYLAKNYFTTDKVVIKTIDPKWQDRDEEMEALFHESELGKKLDHPAIIKSVSSFEEDRNLYYVMTYFESISLDAHLGSGNAMRTRFSLDQALKMIGQMLDALEYLHAMGLRHASLNPSNLLFNTEHQIKLIGCGKNGLNWLRLEPDNQSFHPVMFLAPEQYRGESLTEAANQYSFGVMAYLMLTGQLPWSCNKAENHLKQKEQSFLKPVLDPEMLGSPIPQWLYSILNKCLMIEPSLRFSSIKELKEAILEEKKIPFQVVTTALRKEPAVPPPVVEVVAPAPPQAAAELAPEPIPEPLPEPEAIVEIEPEPVNEPASEYIPEPVEEQKEPEQPKVEIEPEPVVEIEKPHPEEAPLIPEPKAEPQSRPMPVFPPPKPNPQPPAKPMFSARIPASEPEDLSTTRKLFSALIIVTLIIVGYYALKYTVFSDKPKFEVLTTSEAEEETPEVKPKSNRPLDMVAIPADTVVVGTDGQSGDSDEYPSIRVAVPAFLISATEITQAEWMMVARQNPSQFKDDNLPVHNVSFYDVIEWCNEKSLQDGFRPCYDFFNDDIVCDFNADGYRLPTEAEWEYAAKGRSNGQFTLYSGSSSAEQAGWSADNSGGRVLAVKTKARNSFGIWDMSGNVSEWVWNWYAPYSYNVRSVFEGPTSGTDRVVRGGSWFEAPREMRVTNRSFAKPFTDTSYIGFRVVRSTP